MVAADASVVFFGVFTPMPLAEMRPGAPSMTLLRAFVAVVPADAAFGAPRRPKRECLSAQREVFG